MATRAAILASARHAFAEKGYDGAGVREIAQGAGVTAMLVNRYFGSKEQLFGEVLTESMRSTSVLLPKLLQSSTTGEDIAAALIDITRAGAAPLEGFQIMLHSASSKRAAEIGRQHIESNHHQALMQALPGEMAPQRAALLLSLIAGFQMMRQAIGLSALADADPSILVRLLAPLFQQLIDGKPLKNDQRPG